MASMDALLNEFATRCFRDVADHDYISARMNCRVGLISQFQWSAQQAFEKYYKAIFLYNRIPAVEIKHSLGKARKLARRLPFEIRLSISSNDLIEHIDQYGQYRYFETSYFSVGPKLYELDRAVWELRRYCRVMNSTVLNETGESVSMLDYNIQENEEAEERHPRDFKVPGGALENILEKQSHPARVPLIWQNHYYCGSRRRKVINIPMHGHAANSPLYLYPQVLDEAIKYVYIPQSVVNAYRESHKATQ